MHSFENIKLVGDLTILKRQEIAPSGSYLDVLLLSILSAKQTESDKKPSN